MGWLVWHRRASDPGVGHSSQRADHGCSCGSGELQVIENALIDQYSFPAQYLDSRSDLFLNLRAPSFRERLLQRSESAIPFQGI